MTTGEIVPVEGTPMDFTTPKAVGQDIANTDYDQIKFGNGYDHNWVLNTAGDDSQVAAKLVAPTTASHLKYSPTSPNPGLFRQLP